MQLRAIGVIRSPFREPRGTPIQPCMAAGAAGTVEVFEEFAAALKDLDGFDRVWLVYWFHLARPGGLVVKPFMDDAERGLFACRAPRRPNPIGISAVRLLGVEGRVLRVGDVDVVDGTPLLDVKPYCPRFDSYPDARAGWLDERAGRRGVRADGRFDDAEAGPASDA